MKKKLPTICCFILAFIIPVFIFTLILSANEIYPFGDSTILFVDSQGQYITFLSYYRSLFLTNNDLSYTFAKSLGGDMASLMCYYLLSPFNIIYLFFEPINFPLAISIVTILKIGTIGLTMYILMNKLYKNNLIANLIFSVSYSLCSYVIVYNFNFMFLDAVLWLPLIVLGLEKIFAGQRSTFYSVILALSIISNYYTGFMICIFVVMFFLYKMYSQRRLKREKKDLYKTFIISSIIAGGLSAVAWLTAGINMIGTKTSIVNRSPFSMKLLWELPNFLSNFTSGSYKGMEDIISGGPLIFVGITCLALAVMFYLNNKISSDEKTASGIVIAILIACMAFSGLNNLFHGGAEPVWFPFRFSFVFNFFVIYLAAKELYNLDGLHLHHFVLPLAFTIITYAIMSSASLETGIVQDFIILLIDFLLIVLIKRFKNKYVNALSMSLMLLATLYNLHSSAYDNIATNKIESDSGSGSYISYQKYSEQYNEISNVINFVKNYDTTGDFYRLEKTFNSQATYNLANNDSCMFDYAGLSHYSSVEKLDTRSYLSEKLGFHYNQNWNSYGLGSTLTANSLMGIRYILDRDFEHSSVMIPNRYFGARDYLIHLDDYLSKEDSIHIFQNQYALGMGFLAAPRDNVEGRIGEFIDEKHEQIKYYDIFEYQNHMLIDLSGLNLGNVFIPITYTQSYSNINKIDNTHFSLIDSSRPGYITYRLSLSNEALNFPCYYHIKPGYSQYMSLYESSNTSNNLYYFNMYNYAINPINKQNRTSINYTLKLNENLIWDNTEIIPSFYYENIDILSAYITSLKSNEVQLKKISSSHLTGSTKYNSQKSLLTFSIPFDSRWQIKINNQKIKTRINQNIFLAADLYSYNYKDDEILNIEIKYVTPEYTVSIFIGLLAIAYIFLYDYQLYKPIKRIISKKRKAS